MGKIIDVSQWQGTIDWAKAKDELDMVIMRSSCGTGVDKQFKINAEACQKYGIPFGVYHYVMATTKIAALNEIKFFYNTAKLYKPAFWVLDIEQSELLYENGKTLPMKHDFTALVKYLYEELRKRVGSSNKIIYYGGESVYEPYGKLSTIKWDGLWIANYSRKPGMKCDMHQYTSSGKVSGINTKVDMNNLMGDKPLSWWTGGKVVENVQKPEAPVVNINPSRPVLRQGSNGDAVKKLQNLLMTHGYKLPKYGADGDFGGETVLAVKSFQRVHGLVADGIVGEKTWAALESTATKKNRPMLRKGSAGNDVKDLQNALVAAGHKLSVDGVFGLETMSAVMAFQRAKKLSVDGVVGEKTWAALGI